MATEAQSGFSRPLALHISNLHPETTEQEIFQHFSVAGAIANVRILRDAETRLPRGYAYVNFLDQEEAEKALNSLNFSILHGNEIRVMRAIPPSSFNPRANIFVKNLPAGCTTSRFHDAFSGFGAILSARIGQDSSGNLLSHGYLQFETEEAAQAAIKASADGQITIAGEPSNVTATPFVNRAQRESNGAFTNVFVRNFPASWSAEDFVEFAKKFGSVTSHFIRTDLSNPITKSQSETGFAFANYATHEEAVKAIDAMNKEVVSGFPIQAFEAKTKAARQAEKAQLQKAYASTRSNLYVKFIPVDQLSKEEIEGRFRSLGQVNSFVLLTNPQGNYTGVAYVNYADQATAERALAHITSQYRWYANFHIPSSERVTMGQRRFPQPQYVAYHQPYGYPPYPQNMRRYRPRNIYPHHGGMVPLPPRAYGRRHHHQGYPAHPAHPHHVPHHVPPHVPHMMPAHPPQPPAAPAEVHQDRRQVLGEKLYYRVAEISPDRAPKITGMLLEMSEAEINGLLDNAEELKAKVMEAIEVLTKAGQ